MQEMKVIVDLVKLIIPSEGGDRGYVHVRHGYRCIDVQWYSEAPDEITLTQMICLRTALPQYDVRITTYDAGDDCPRLALALYLKTPEESAAGDLQGILQECRRIMERA
jgi:hypothetical protein